MCSAPAPQLRSSPGPAHRGRHASRSTPLRPAIRTGSRPSRRCDTAGQASPGAQFKLCPATLSLQPSTRRAHTSCMPAGVFTDGAGPTLRRLGRGGPGGPPGWGLRGQAGPETRILPGPTSPQVTTRLLHERIQTRSPAPQLGPHVIPAKLAAGVNPPARQLSAIAAARSAHSPDIFFSPVSSLLANTPAPPISPLLSALTRLSRS